MDKLKRPPTGQKITAADFYAAIDHINEAIDRVEAVNKKHAEFESKLDNFYSKQIELFGLFIAIFSFLIAGIQMAAKSEGTFWNRLSTSGAIFIPIIISICILFYLIRRILKK
jgi:hypothetical protein